MPKGKPWTKEEEQTLIKLVRKGKAVDVIAKVLGKNEDMIYHKMRRLGLRVEVGSDRNQPPSSSRSKLPGELPSIENVMKRLSAALEALEQPGIEKRRSSGSDALFKALRSTKRCLPTTYIIERSRLNWWI